MLFPCDAIQKDPPVLHTRARYLSLRKHVGSDPISGVSPTEPRGPGLVDWHIGITAHIGTSPSCTAHASHCSQAHCQDHCRHQGWHSRTLANSCSPCCSAVCCQHIDALLCLLACCSLATPSDTTDSSNTSRADLSSTSLMPTCSSNCTIPTALRHAGTSSACASLSLTCLVNNLPVLCRHRRR